MAEMLLECGTPVLVDDADLALVSGRCWSLHNEGYAHTYIDGRQVLMHRFLLGAGPRQWCDHRDGNKLDNRRANLRLATPSQNAANRAGRGASGYKGVSSRLKYIKLKDGTRKGLQYYIAIVTHRGKRHEVKWSKDPVVCARAYDVKARELFGEFARVNFP